MIPMKNSKRIYTRILLIVFFCFPTYIFAQFYNGHQMSFGKNRVQYNNWYWQYFRFERFDTYFHENGRELALYTEKVAQKKLFEIESLLGYYMEKRIIFIIYNKLSEFRQSNIGLVSGDDQSNVGGVTQIVDNKVFLYYEGDHKKFDRQISAAIAEVILTEMMFGQNFREKVTNSTLMNMPEWYFQGLISYLSNSWDFEIENIVKDGILTNKYKKFNQLRADDAKYAGHSIWHFLAESYGKEIIPNIIYMTRINKNPEIGFTYVLGAPIKEIKPLWLDFYKTRFNKQLENSVMPDSGQIIKRPRKNTVYQQVKVSPNKKYMAYVTNSMGKYKIFILDNETGKIKKILRREHKLEQITDYTMPLIAWHPTGKMLAYLTEEQGMIFLNNYFVETKELRRRQMLYFDKILDFSYSDDGFSMVLSAVMNGQTDIFVFNVAAGTNERITQDLADDMNPRFTDKSTKIVFSSNRLTDTLEVERKEHKPFGNTYDLFIYNYKARSNILTRLTTTPYVNETNPIQIRRNSYQYLSDQNGIVNRYMASFDSTINYIDTTTHYRYFTSKYPVSNYFYNVTNFDINIKAKSQAEVVFNKGKYYMFQNELYTKKDAFKGKYFETDSRATETKNIIKMDSLKKVEILREARDKIRRDSLLANLKGTTILTDTSNIDINNYVFEKEKGEIYDLLVKKDTALNKNKSDTVKTSQQRVYLTSFYVNYVVNQVDFGSLNTSYQSFTGSAFYFNPGFNLFFKVGVNDLFEDYKIVGGIRFAGDFDSNEYLLSFENLKKRLDKQYIFHRQTMTNSNEVYVEKVTTHEGMYILRYPFNQVLALKTTFSLRNDKAVLMSTDRPSLKEPNQERTFSSVKLEYIFDNTINTGLNFYNGVRYKIFGEAYQQVDGNRTNLFVLGADFRYYQKIHRDLIFASRFAASTSFGKSRLIYYLGGVDNWTALSPNVKMFDYSIPIDTTKRYVYQAVATNMRGFVQNVRNGENFALINNEIRFPIIRYFANRPINSDFWNNLQIVGFLDAGTAWSGINPFDDKSAYNQEVIRNGPLTLTVDKNRSPIVFGYGYGVRSRLFGYFIRLDWAWGVDGHVILPRIFYFSLNLDF